MARPYTPRRSGKRWREQCPAGILDCFDNKGQTADRYMVMFVPEPGAVYEGTVWIDYLAASENPSHPQGVGITGQMKAHEASNYRYRNGHRRVRWLDLPEAVRKSAEHYLEPEPGTPSPEVAGELETFR